MKRLALRALVILFAAVSFSAAWSVPPSKPVKGPMVVCFKYSVFHLRAGEEVVDFQPGLEDMKVHIKSPGGEIIVGEGGVWAEPDARRTLLFQAGDTKVYHYDGYGSYAVFGPADFDGGQDRLFIWLTIKGLAKRDHKSVFERFEIRDPEGASCRHGFSYGGFFEE